MERVHPLDQNKLVNDDTTLGKTISLLPGGVSSSKILPSSRYAASTSSKDGGNCSKYMTRHARQPERHSGK